MYHHKQIVNTLKERGYRITPQRELIVQIFSQIEKHQSVEEIYDSLQKITTAINLATVYRTLELLWREGFAQRNDLSDGRVFFAPPIHGTHIHLVCRKCNQVIDADAESVLALDAEFVDKYNFKADLDHISIFGVCEGCDQNEPDLKEDVE